MPLSDILTSLHGRRIGLNRAGSLVINKPPVMNGAATSPAIQEVLGRSLQLTLTAAQVNALFSTPITIVPAEGVGFGIFVNRVALSKAAGTAYTVGGTSDLVLKYTNASGQQCSSVIETTGFLDQTTAQTRYACQPGSTGATAADVTPVDNGAIVLHCLNANPSGGTGGLTVRVWFDVYPIPFV